MKSSTVFFLLAAVVHPSAAICLPDACYQGKREKTYEFLTRPYMSLSVFFHIVVLLNDFILGPAAKDCKSYLATTVIPAPTSRTTVTITTGSLDRTVTVSGTPSNTQTIAPSATPAYAAVCLQQARYSSACSCLSVTPSFTTASASGTVTDTVFVPSSRSQGLVTAAVTAVPIQTSAVYLTTTVTETLVQNLTITDVVTQGFTVTSILTRDCSDTQSQRYESSFLGSLTLLSLQSEIFTTSATSILPSNTPSLDSTSLSYLADTSNSQSAIATERIIISGSSRRAESYSTPLELSQSRATTSAPLTTPSALSRSLSQRDTTESSAAVSTNCGFPGLTPIITPFIGIFLELSDVQSRCNLRCGVNPTCLSFAIYDTFCFLYYQRYESFVISTPGSKLLFFDLGDNCIGTSTSSTTSSKSLSLVAASSSSTQTKPGGPVSTAISIVRIPTASLDQTSTVVLPALTSAIRNENTSSLSTFATVVRSVYATTPTTIAAPRSSPTTLESAVSRAPSSATSSALALTTITRSGTGVSTIAPTSNGLTSFLTHAATTNTGNSRASGSTNYQISSLTSTTRSSILTATTSTRALTVTTTSSRASSSTGAYTSTTRANTQTTTSTRVMTSSSSARTTSSTSALGRTSSTSSRTNTTTTTRVI